MFEDRSSVGLCPCRAGDTGPPLSIAHPVTFCLPLSDDYGLSRLGECIPEHSAKALQPAAAGQPLGRRPTRGGAGRDGAESAHLHWPHLHLRGPALHVAVVAAARAALHLHAGRPHQEIGVGAIYEVPRDLEHLCARLALGDYSGLCGC